MKYIAIVGTNANLSYNRKLLFFLQNYFNDKAEIDVVDIKNIPMFNEDRPLPNVIKQLAEKIDQADGVIFGVPEYDHSIPSSLKSLVEWLSWQIHPLKDRPIMLVGTSLGNLGSARAQQHLRQILDSPGIGAAVMPGNEFLLGFAESQFSNDGSIKDQKTIDFLTQCFNNFIHFSKEVNRNRKENGLMNNDKVQWSAIYDVIVIGFGAAGATAARFAADNDAKVLLVDAAPEGHEGGNTRYAGQVILTGHDLEKTRQYFKQLFGPYKIDPEILETYIKGINDIPNYLKNYLEIKEPISYNKVHRDPDFQAFANGLSPEYPEFKGSDTIDLTTVHDGYFDASLWKVLRHQVEKRSNKIDLWLDSPALHLIQNSKNKVIEGVQINRKGQKVNVKANNGVVLSLGGFENEPDYIQNFIGVPKLKVIGTLYNKGDGIKMVQEVGATLWHLHSYEGFGFNGGFTFDDPDEQRGKFILSPWPELSSGSIFIAADDGSRYIREDENGRHGHIYDHGSWKTPTVFSHPHLIFDQAQFDVISKQKNLPYENFFDITVKADTISELAEKISVDPEILQKTIDDFDRFAKNGEDQLLNRNKNTLKAFGAGPFYATPIATAMLNTQGGAKRNAQAEVLDADDRPIPHLYSAGEFGGINENQYNGGGNLAECLIFGKIAGQNAAKDKKDELLEVNSIKADENLLTNDFEAADKLSKKFKTGPHEYLGSSQNGIGGKVVVRVKYENNKIEKVDILEQSESEDVGIKAVQKLPKEMVEQNSYQVDAVSGASASSRAIKEAVKNALEKANLLNPKAL